VGRALQVREKLARVREPVPGCRLQALMTPPSPRTALGYNIGVRRQTKGTSGIKC